MVPYCSRGVLLMSLRSFNFLKSPQITSQSQLSKNFFSVKQKFCISFHLYMINRSYNRCKNQIKKQLSSHEQDGVIVDGEMGHSYCALQGAPQRQLHLGILKQQRRSRTWFREACIEETRGFCLHSVCFHGWLLGTIWFYGACLLIHAQICLEMVII